MPRTLIQASLNTLTSAGCGQGALDAYATGNLIPADPVNLNNFTATGRDLLVIFNDDTEAQAGTVTNVTIAPVSGAVVTLGGVIINNPQVLTVAMANPPFVPGQTVTFGTINTLASPPVASPISGLTVEVLAVTSVGFTAVVNLSSYTSTPSTGPATSAPATHYFVLHSAPDPQGRSATVGSTCEGQYTIAPGEYVQVWIPSVALFQQTDGTIWIDADSANIEFLLTH
jgi:hypothetical protein